MLLKISIFPKLSLIQRVVAGFAIAFVMILLLSVLTDANRQQQIDADHQVAYSQSVIDALESTLSVVKDAETGTRGYVITGDETYLEPYYSALGHIDAQMSHLSLLIGPNSDQSALLSKLTPKVKRRLEIASDVVGLRRDRGFVAAQQRVLSGEGKLEMDAIRLLVDQMQTLERTKLAQLTARTNLNTTGTSWILLTVPFCLGFLALISFQIRHEMKARHLAEQALVVSEGKLKAIVETTSDPIYLKDTQSRYTLINQAGAALFEKTPEQIQGMSDVDLLGEIKGRQVVERDAAVLARGEAVNYESSMIAQNRTIVFNTTKFPYRSPSGDLLGLVGISRDVTENKRTEYTLRKQREELSVLNSTTLGLLSGLDIHSLLDVVVVNASKLLDVQDAFLLVLDDDGQHMTVQSATGTPKDAFIKKSIVRGEGLSGLVWSTGKKQAVADYSVWDNRSSDSESANANRRAVGAVPLFVGGEVVGVLGMSRNGDDRVQVSDDDLNLLERFGQLVALALQNAKLYEVSQREVAVRKKAEVALLKQTDELAALNDTTFGLLNGLETEAVLEAIVVNAAKLLGVADTFLFVVDDDGKSMTARTGTGVFINWIGTRLVSQEGLAGLVWKNNSSLCITDYAAWEHRVAGMERARMRAVGEVPVRIGGEVVGVLGMAHTGDDKAQFSNEEMDLLARFSQLASMALQNAHLYTLAQQEIAERKRAEEALHLLATRDELTGLFNRREFMRLLTDEMSRCWRYKRPMSLILLDIDHFKKVNDTYGHQAGDAVLACVSKLIKDTVRTNDRPARYGGEEFAIIVPELGARSTWDFAERLRCLVAETPCVIESKDGEKIELPVTFSLGVASLPTDGDTEEALIAAADAALYEAKRGGRNRSVMAGEGTVVGSR